MNKMMCMQQCQDFHPLYDLHNYTKNPNGKQVLEKKGKHKLKIRNMALY